MFFIQAIIDFFRKLFGMDDAAPAAAISSGTDNRSAVERNVKGLENVQGAEHIQVKEANDENVIKRYDGAVLFRDEDDGEELWSSTVDLEIAKDQWQDVWGPLSGPDDLGKFLFHETQFNLKMQGDALEAEEEIKGFGYKDPGEFFKVRVTMLKHKGEGGPLLEDMVFTGDDVMRAAMEGGHMHVQNMAQKGLEANPELLAPVDGVDLDTYAKLAANSASGMAEADFHKMLGEHGLDVAKWQKVNAEWTDRMSKDTSHAITTAYGKAFAMVGAGKHGAAGQAAGNVMYTTGAAGGDEPVSFEKYCEIQGAQTAWSNSGQDVNAMLKQVFDMTAVDWSTMSMWWMQKMQAEPSLWNKHSELTAKYEKQYGGNAMAGADDDLSF